jgi:nitrite reductase/ring-hydroxylating ferredoxin subunit
MAQFVKVARTADLAADEAKCVEVGGKKIARSTWRGASTSSTTNRTHRGDPLSEGEVSGKKVT